MKLSLHLFNIHKGGILMKHLLLTAALGFGFAAQAQCSEAQFHPQHASELKSLEEQIERCKRDIAHNQDRIATLKRDHALKTSGAHAKATMRQETYTSGATPAMRKSQASEFHPQDTAEIKALEEQINRCEREIEHNQKRIAELTRKHAQTKSAAHAAVSMKQKSYTSAA